LETIGRVRAIALDKTGTLTTGQLQVVKTLRSQPSQNRVLQVAAALEVFLNIQLDKQLSAAQQQRLEFPLLQVCRQKLGKVLLEKSMVSEW